MAVQTSTDDAVRERFHSLAEDWKRKSRYLSNTAQMAMLPAYQGIIGMGDGALPFIFDELQREPDHWFWALESITQENPVTDEDAGNVPQMTAAWLAWGKERGYIS